MEVMKKAYISPTVTVAPLRHRKVLLAGSPTFTVHKDEESVNPEDTW